MSESVQDIPTQPLADFLNTIPSPLTTVLIGLGSHVSKVRHLVEILSWKSPWEESWLALALWWAACLLGDVALRYVLPIAMLSVLFVARWTSTTQVIAPPITEDDLQKTISDLTAIHALLPTLPKAPSSNVSVLLRVSAILYLPYLLLTYFVQLRVLIAITGTIILTWRAPWASLIRRGFWRSAWIRWFLYHIWARLSGQPLPPRTLSPQSQASISAVSSGNTPSTNPVNSIRFLFTVYENQRWWMGLDWTAALLPGERPSWCSASQQAVAPPSIFSLPAPTTVYMKEGNGRVKRTARWHWEEDEWRVVVHREGSILARVERPLPSLEKETTGSVGSANRILKVAGKMRQASLGSYEGSLDHKEESDSGKSVDKTNSGFAQNAEELFTDVDGWVYGDNKWESISAKGSMGKYTRFRRWTRIAVLTETVEPAEPGEVGILKEGITEVPKQLPALQAQPEHEEHGAETVQEPRSSVDDDRARLRQRLQAAVKGASHS